MVAKIKKFSPVLIFGRAVGQSMVEIVVALGVFAIAAAALVSLILGGQILGEKSSELARAGDFLQEGREAVYSVKNRAWNGLIFNQSGFILNDFGYQLAGEGTTDFDGLFTRTINFFPVYRNDRGEVSDRNEPGTYLDVLSKKIIIRVSRFIDQKEIITASSVEIISNWNAEIWEQDDWSQGAWQIIWSNPAKYYRSDGNINISKSGEISLREISTSTFVISGYLLSSAFGVGRPANYSAISWEEEIPNDCASCLVLFQIMAAPDEGGAPGIWPDIWSGPDGEDGDEDDFFTISAGELIDQSHNGRQWIKYKVVLRGDGAHTPILKKVKIFYQ